MITDFGNGITEAPLPFTFPYLLKFFFIYTVPCSFLSPNSPSLRIHPSILSPRSGDSRRLLNTLLSLLMAVISLTSSPLLLRAIFRDLESETTLHSTFMVVHPFQGYSEIVRALADVVGTKDDNITVFIERINGGWFRMMANSDLIRQKAVCLRVNVGLPRGACKVCDKALNYCLIREFHLCNEDKPISTISDGYFRSSAGPIQRPSRVSRV